MKRPDLAEIYRSVAKELEEEVERAVRLGPFVCNLLTGEAKEVYVGLFNDSAYYTLYAFDWEPMKDAPQLAPFSTRTSYRILALCFAAALAEAGDLL